MLAETVAQAAQAAQAESVMLAAAVVQGVVQAQAAQAAQTVSVLIVPAASAAQAHLEEITLDYLAQLTAA
jgi:hypothetical protein